MKGKLLILSLFLAIVMIAGGLVGCTGEKTPTTTPTTPGGSASPTKTTGPTPTQQAIKWRMQGTGSPGMFSYDYFDTRMVKRIEELTGGQLTIEMFAENVIVGSSQGFDALAKGTIDMQRSSTAYVSGFIPSASIDYGLDWSFDNLEDYQYVHLFAQPKSIEQLFDEETMKLGVKTVASGPGLSYGGMPSTKPVRKVEDLKGMKVRSYALTARILEKAGASVVTIPAAEMYTALTLGTIDATSWTGPQGAFERSLHEVCKYYIDPPSLPWCESSIFSSMTSFNKLSAAQKAAIMYSGKLWEMERAAIYPRIDAEAKRKMIDQFKVEWITLPPSETAKLREISIKLWDEFAAKDAVSAKMIEIYKEHMKVKGLV